MPTHHTAIPGRAQVLPSAVILLLGTSTDISTLLSLPQWDNSGIAEVVSVKSDSWAPSPSSEHRLATQQHRQQRRCRPARTHEYAKDTLLTLTDTHTTMSLLRVPHEVDSTPYRSPGNDWLLLPLCYECLPFDRSLGFMPYAAATEVPLVENHPILAPTSAPAANPEPAGRLYAAT